MSEYKTYSCDKCGEHNALRLFFVVGFEHDPVDGHPIEIQRPLDLCARDLAEFAQEFISALTHDMQHLAWKRWSKK